MAEQPCIHCGTPVHSHSLVCKTCQKPVTDTIGATSDSRSSYEQGGTQMVCTTCNASVPEGNPFCHLCGAKLPEVMIPLQGGASPPSGAAGFSGQPGKGANPAIPGGLNTAVYRSAARSPNSRYSGASLVASTILVIGWLIAIAAPIFGIYLASNYDPGPFEENVGTTRFLLFVGSALAGWLYTVMILWSGYVLRLLSDIERNTVGGSSRG